MPEVSRLCQIGFDAEHAKQISFGFVGEIKMGLWVAANLPEGWLLCNGDSVGNVSSGGTARAANDTWDLFELLWTNATDSELAVQTSGGGASTRGASATADWEANKRLLLPDMRGKSPLVQAASGTGSTMADTSGSLDHTHSVPAHYHGMGTGADLNVGVLTAGGGSSARLVNDTAGDGTHNYDFDDVSGRIGLVTGGVDGNASMTSGTQNHAVFVVNAIIAY